MIRFCPLVSNRHIESAPFTAAYLSQELLSTYIFFVCANMGLRKRIFPQGCALIAGHGGMIRDSQYVKYILTVDL